MKLVRITISPKEAQLVLKYAERALAVEAFLIDELADATEKKVELLSCRKGIERMKDSLKRSEKRSL